MAKHRKKPKISLKIRLNILIFSFTINIEWD